VVLRTALAARRRHLDAVGPGPAGVYRPLAAEGADADRVLAVARGAEPSRAVVVARPGRDLDVDASGALPAGRWTERFTGRAVEGTVAVADLHAEVPVALLER
jgi:(1->4)-alpha-D-glucan 1-alpha-D-glucosylmutase